MKRIISAGLCTAFILSLAGCARQDTTPSLTAADTTDTQMGRWVESRVDLGGEPLISYPTQLADGTIVLYTGKVGEDSIEDYTRRTSTDGTNWTSEPAAFDVGDAMVTWILVAPDGEQALITYDGENAGLVLQAPDGTKTVVEDDTVKQGINPNTAVFQGDKLDFVSNGDTVDFVQVSLTDGSVTTAALPQDLAYSLNSLTTVGNQLVYLSFDNNTGDIILNALDPATGASTELLNPVPNATSSQALTGDADGAAYYACTDGIYRLAPGGTLPEQVVPAEGTAMSISSNYPLSLLRTAAEDFMVLLFGDSGGNGDLYFYHYSDEYYTALPDDQKYALALASGVDFAKLLLPSSANALLHDGALDADALTKIFTFVKTTADYYGMADYINTEMDGVSSQSYDNSDIVTIDAQQDEYSTCSRAKFGWMDVATPYAVIAMARTNDIFDADAEAVPVDMIPMPGLTQGAYNPQVLVGVNANSKNPDAAKGLAAAFFGTDVQSQYCSDGTTVRADCLREKLDAVKATVSGAKTGKVTGAYVGDLDAFYANCTTPVLFPVMLQQSFINHAQAIIDGSEDVAAAVAGVQSDLALYLAEQK